MKKFLLGFLVILFFSCGPKKKVNIAGEFGFKNRMPPTTITNAYAFWFSEADTIANGGIYRAKVFLANGSKVYNIDSLEPIIKYKLSDSSSWNDVRDYGIPVPVFNDTGLVKMVVQDSTLKKGQFRKVTWRASVTIPLPKMDTTFAIKHEFILVGK